MPRLSAARLLDFGVSGFFPPPCFAADAPGLPEGVATPPPSPAKAPAKGSARAGSGLRSSKIEESFLPVLRSSAQRDACLHKRTARIATVTRSAESEYQVAEVIV